jgi:uncharacterized surface anchored protein
MEGVMVSSKLLQFLSLLITMSLLMLPISVSGDQDPTIVHGMVFKDSDQDGIFDDGEEGIEGVNLDLVMADEVTQSTASDANGYFEFTGLEMVSYSVIETDPTNYTSSTLNEVTFDIDGMTIIPTIYFGDVPLDALAEISGKVFDDISRNRIPDPGEPGLPSVTILLKDSEGELLDSMVTDENGNYSFDELWAGVYTIREEDPAGYYSATPHEITLSLAVGEVRADVHFGDFYPESGELAPIDPFIADFFDLPILDILDLRTIEKMGYGNVAKVYFASMLSGEPVINVLELLETEGGWGNVWKTVVGFSGLKGYNLGMVVSGREAPTPVLQLLDGCPVVETPEQLHALMASGINQGSLKKLCGMVMETGGDYDVLMEAVNLRVDEMKWKEIQESIENPGGESQEDPIENTNGENQEDPAEHGPPACKGKNKNDPGC